MPYASNDDFPVSIRRALPAHAQDIFQGRRQTISVPVRSVIKSYFGLTAYMDLAALNEMLDDGPRVTGVHIAYDRALEDRLFQAIKTTPAIASVALRKSPVRRS